MPRPWLVLGLGNDLLGDDGVGLKVIEALRRRPSLAAFDFQTAEGAGLCLLDVLSGYQRAFVVDCLACCDEPPGRVHALSAEEVADRALDLSSHYVGLPQVLALGQRLGLPMPEVQVLAITVEDPYRIGMDVSPALRRRLPGIVEEIERAVLEGCHA